MVSFDASLGNYHYRYFQKANWMLVFYHNITGSNYFDNVSEAEHTLNSTQKYSIFTEITPKLKFGGKYEFLLQWGSSNISYNRWKQTNNPIEEEEVINKYEVDGFEANHLDYNDEHIDGYKFGGLAKTTIPAQGCINSYLKGSLGHDYWFYGLGQFNVCDLNWVDYIPTPSQNETVAHLWVRIAPYDTACSFKSYVPLHLFIIALMF